MKCPLFIMANLHLRKDIPNPDTDCIKLKCAWWGTWIIEGTKAESGCCIQKLTSIMAEIMSKLPHES